MNTFPEYSGYAYDTASREGLKLVKQAAKDQCWFSILDRLIALRQIMNDHFDKAM